VHFSINNNNNNDDAQCLHTKNQRCTQRTELVPDDPVAVPVVHFSEALSTTVNGSSKPTFVLQDCTHQAGSLQALECNLVAYRLRDHSRVCQNSPPGSVAMYLHHHTHAPNHHPPHRHTSTLWTQRLGFPYHPFLAQDSMRSFHNSKKETKTHTHTHTHAYREESVTRSWHTRASQRELKKPCLARLCR
jgi:hypothetical protein